MARGINKVILVGNLGADPEVRHTPNGGQVTNIRLATSETWRDRQSGDQQERTEWHRVVFFGRLAEIAAQYLARRWTETQYDVAYYAGDTENTVSEGTHDEPTSCQVYLSTSPR